MYSVPNAAAKSANGIPTPTPTPIAVPEPLFEGAQVGEVLLRGDVELVAVDDVFELDDVEEADAETMTSPAIPLTFPFGMSKSSPFAEFKHID